MAPSPFALPFERLPATLPIFPLPHAIVMPGCQLPLNIFEPRYLNLVFDALGAERLIGMVQPDPTAPHKEAVYATGTAGRIVSFGETPDGRLLIVLAGVCRFDIREEIPTVRGYRRVLVDWSRFRQDLDTPGEAGGGYDRLRLMALLKEYLQRKGVEINWTNLEQIPSPLLVNVLAGQLPFDVPERQALVEAVTPEERMAKLASLLEFDVVGTVATNGRRH
ncbi:LON peptidase substrate-binding domain-containing protein [Candidatus Methylocalor cossyra]|uniref:Lon N-terminal domain-containing protein n=1 Tax=Candidatus Methylocalor cossyra TaxID=3108543 RepID=A0ABM9NM33_9GAMM